MQELQVYNNSQKGADQLPERGNKHHSLCVTSLNQAEKSSRLANVGGPGKQEGFLLSYQFQLHHRIVAALFPFDQVREAVL